MLVACLFALVLPPSPYAAMLAGCAYLRADPEGSGTAWVVNAEKKWLLTCRHVVGEQTRVEIFFPLFEKGTLRTLRSEYISERAELKDSGHLVVGKVLKTSDAFDLALVEVPSFPKGVRALPLATSAATLGLPVWAIGHRGDVDTLWNLSSGSIRQRGRIADGYFWQAKPLLENAPGLVVQLPIAEGDSGGPIANYQGDVVGVMSAFRNRSPSATLGPDAGSIRKFLEIAEPIPQSRGREGAETLARSTVWVRPTATDVRTAGAIVDARRRWVLTSASGLGKNDRVGVAFPEVVDGRVNGERDAYRDPVALHLKKLWVPGTVLLRDGARDLAVIELDWLPPNLQAVPFALKDAEPGEKVHSISHPTGLEFAFVTSSGTVKQRGTIALGRDTAKVEALLLQLPAQGNASGGPVANSRGDLLGVLAGKEAPNQQAAYAAATSEVRAFLAEAKIEAIRQPLLRMWNAREWLLRRALFFSGLENIRQERWKAAIESFDAIIEAESLNRTALLFRAEAWRKTKEPKKAIADLQRLLDFDPADVPVRFAYAQAWADAGDTDRAVKERMNAEKLK